jgi:hypothetical protein
MFECPCGYKKVCNDKKILNSVSKRHSQFCEISNQYGNKLEEIEERNIKIDYCK